MILKPKSLIHIAYGDSAAGCIREALRKGMPGDGVIVCRDDYTQGPINEALVEGGLEQRSKYWSSLEAVKRYQDDVKESYASTLRKIDNLASNVELVLWIGNSAHDKLASAWLITYLNEKTMRWSFIDLSEVEVEDNDDVVNAAMLSPDQMVESYKQVKELSKDFAQNFIMIWSNIAAENSAYRIWQDGQILSVCEDYFDDNILSFITKKPQLLGKLLGKIMSENTLRLSDVTIETRLQHLHHAKKVKMEVNLVQHFLTKVWK